MSFHLPGVPRLDRLAGHAGAAVLNALTPRTNEPEGIPAPQSFGDYMKSQAAAFNPLHPAGAFNLASMFFPGGGKFGRLTQEQKEYMNQIHNIGKTGDYRISSRSRATGVWPFTKEQVEANPDLRIIAEVLGHGSAMSPLWQNRAHVDPEMFSQPRERLENPQPFRADMLLGAGPGGRTNINPHEAVGDPRFPNLAQRMQLQALLSKFLEGQN